MTGQDSSMVTSTTYNPSRGQGLAWHYFSSATRAFAEPKSLPMFRYALKPNHGKIVKMLSREIFYIS